MENLSSKLFSKGLQALANNDYLLAEKFFLASLYRSNQDDDYTFVLGSIDQLSLYVYSKGYSEIKERAIEFYKIVYEKDGNASFVERKLAVTEFFNNPANIPDLDTLENLLAEDTPRISGDDKEYQLKNLKAIYNAASLAPVFHQNLKYSTGKFAELTPYIAYSDVLNDKYIIRGREGSEHNSFDDEKRVVIAEYSSLEKLVNDGWRLD